MPGLGAEVLRRLGAIVVTLPGTEIVPALKSGAIDASEWVGPWLDMAMGLHGAAGYYYYPGFHEPGTGSAVGINKGVWDSFDASDQRVIEAVAACEYARSLRGAGPPLRARQGLQATRDNRDATKSSGQALPYSRLGYMPIRPGDISSHGIVLFSRPAALSLPDARS
jgi:hypothetical protein